MNYLVRKKPLLLSGLTLALAALGNLIGQYGQAERYLFGTLSLLIFFLITYFIVNHFNEYKLEMANPVVSSTFGTYSMCGMLLSTYFVSWSGSFARIFWFFFFLLHVFLIILFTWKYTIKRDILMVYPSWFIVYVGVVIASITGPVHQFYLLGQIAFWFGFVAYLLLFPIVFYRIIIVRQIPSELMPNLAINSAPASLLLAGYINIFQSHSIYLIYFLFILSQLLFFYTLIILIKLMTDYFSPSFSAFTFPFVITAISLTATTQLLGLNSIIMNMLVTFETWFSVMIVSYVLIGFIRFYLSK